MENTTTAKVILVDPRITVTEVAMRLGVSPAKLYRHLPAARSAVQEAEGA